MPAAVDSPVRAHVHPFLFEMNPNSLFRRLSRFQNGTLEQTLSLLGFLPFSK